METDNLDRAPFYYYVNKNAN